jgi:hypothetical protein
MAIWSAISSVKQATRNAYLPAQEQLRVHLEQAGAPYPSLFYRRRYFCQRIKLVKLALEQFLIR